MKSRAYRPSHDRIIIPNASSEHFKGHFIPVPTPHNTSQQSRWPDLNQVPLAGLWCPTPSDQQDICRANSIRFTLVSQKRMDLSLSDTAAHSFAAAHARMSHVDTEESKRHSRGARSTCARSETREHLSPCVTSLKFFVFVFVRSNGAVKSEETDGNGGKHLWGHWNGHHLRNKLIKAHAISAPLRWLLLHNLSHSGFHSFKACPNAQAPSS